MPQRRLAVLLVLALALAPLSFMAGLVRLQVLSANAPAGNPQAWSLDEAVAHLTLQPKDPYLQYVAMQLARRENRHDQIAQEIQRLSGGDRQLRAGRRDQVDLFTIFTGALAVQESLQLDTMRGGPRRPNLQRAPQPVLPAKPPIQDDGGQGRFLRSLVKVVDIKGPTIRSHPWSEMLAGKRPKVTTLAQHVPEDFYLIEFGSVNKLLQASDLVDQWGSYLSHQTFQEARTQQTGARLRRQLAVEVNKLAQPFYDVAVQDVAVAGSDLFIREGSDVTLLFNLSQPDVFKQQMNKSLETAEKSRPDAKRSAGEFMGVAFVHVSTPDREVNVYSAYPAADLHVRSNSKIGFERIIEAIQGKSSDGKEVKRLGDSLEYAYVRTLMPRESKDEDGFVYLSDPFIRKLVGPQVKLTERRRMICYNHLRMMGHAALLYRTEKGDWPDSLATLAKAQCSPGTFGDGMLICPDGGKYTLNTERSSGACSHHGHSHYLTPCCEIPTAQVTQSESQEYQQFLAEYNQYWRTFFDPIGIRIQMTPEKYRLETIILPLIDNSIYSGMAMTLGGKPEPLDALPVPKRNIFSVAVRVNKEQLLRQAGIEVGQAEPEKALGVVDGRKANALQQVGIAMHTFHSDFEKFPNPKAGNNDKKKGSLLSWRVHLLPYLQQAPLYHKFRLDQPWDSDHNKKLIAQMPAVFKGRNERLNAQGKTNLLLPIGRDTLFPPDKATHLVEARDGTSNTIMIMDAADESAVIWTKPDDLEIDLKQPDKGLFPKGGDGTLVCFADGSVRYIRSTIDSADLKGLFTMSGNEVVRLDARNSREVRLAGSRGGPLDLFGLGGKEFEKLNYKDFLVKGIGSQIGLHAYDSPPLFDLSMPKFLGELMGSGGLFSRRGFDDFTMIAGFVVSAINSPTYISIPVQDAKVVDEFLDQLDTVLAVQARKPAERGFFGFDVDCYRLPQGNENYRCAAIGFGPVKIRLFWSRIGNGLYIASKSFILDDLKTAVAQPPSRSHDYGPAAHAMLRLRPENWNQVLSDYRLGWAENNREACLNNLGPLANVARAFAKDESASPEAARFAGQMQRQAELLHGVHFYCPEDGAYSFSADGKSCTCKIHGSPHNPQQPAAPNENKGPGKLLAELKGLTATLTFMEDGLHAVVTIYRK